jgi:hypothetical protein
MKLFRLLLIGLVFFTSCKEKEKPVTRQEAQTFADNLQKSIVKRETDFFDNAFSISGITKIIEDSLKDKYSKNELGGMKEGFRNKLKMGTQLVAVMSEGATYQLVKIYEENSEQHILFRLYDDGKLNYHDMRMVHEKGEVKITDMFIYAAGENLSETLIGFFNGVMTKNEDEALSNLDKVKSIKELILRSKNREALAEIEELPEKLRTARPVQLLRMSAAMNLDDDNDSTYLKVIDEFNALYPDNGKMALMLLDGYVLHKEYDKALACVNQLDSLINKDPVLDFYRAMCFKLKKDETAARACLERLNTNMPSFVDGGVELAFNYCHTQEWEKAGTLLTKIKNYRGFRPELMTQVKILYPEVEKYITN